MRRPLSAVLLVACAGVLVSASGQQPTVAAPQTSAGSHGPALAKTRQCQSLPAVSAQVVDGLSRPVPAATIELKSSEPSGSAATADTLHGVTDASGTYSFTGLSPGLYTVRTVLPGISSQAVVDLSKTCSASARLVLGTGEGAGAASASARAAHQGIEFSDQPNFTVAGVTDWTAVGGHGSDATLRTSEDLARQTLTLKKPDGARDLAARPSGTGNKAEGTDLHAALAADPKSYLANHALGAYYVRTAQYAEAVPVLEAAVTAGGDRAEDEYDLALACRGVGDARAAQGHVQRALAKENRAAYHRLSSELEEQLGDPLQAVGEAERAAQLEPSEENFFGWGSELLLHRAVWEAEDVFARGSKAFPASGRLKMAWGTALFAGARYAEAAEQMCAASDLNSADPEPYLFMGEVNLAAPGALPCVEQRLSRFVQMQPGNAVANFLYAMALHRRADPAEDARVGELLTRAVALNPQYAEAYLQLGILSSAQGRNAEAIAFYQKAVQADPRQVEAHYRLGIAYDRLGDKAKARQELEQHDRLREEQADSVERQRRQVKQFLVQLQDQPRTNKER